MDTLQLGIAKVLLYGSYTVGIAIAICAIVFIVLECFESILDYKRETAEKVEKKDDNAYSYQWDLARQEQAALYQAYVQQQACNKFNKANIPPVTQVYEDETQPGMKDVTPQVLRIEEKL